MNALCRLLACGFLATVSIASAHDAASDADADIRYLAMRIAADHPGMVNPRDATFRRKADAAETQALSMASKARSAGDYRQLVTAYIASFDDPHVSVDLPDAVETPVSQTASAPPEKKARFDRIGPGVARVDIPTFYAGDPAFDSVVEITAELEQQLRQTMPNVLVIDLRGNGGGAAQPGDRLLAAIWGPNAPDALNRRRSKSSAWRVSPYVLHDLEQRRSRIAERYPTELAEFDALLTGLRTALRKGETLYEEPIAQATKHGELARGPKQVFVITDAACISACLDFMDRILEAPHVVQVGEPTGWDTFYTEVESVSLPSGRGTATIPVQLLQGRQRASRERYRPAIAVKGDAAVDAWIAGISKRGS